MNLGEIFSAWIVCMDWLAKKGLHILEGLTN